MKGNDSLTATPQTFDWQSCVDAFTDARVLSLILRHRYSRAFCHWLKENRLIGKYKDCFAFPVHDRADKVVAIHYRLRDSSWRYYPEGTKVHPLVIGKLVPGDTVHIFESQWDAFAFMDKSGECGRALLNLLAGSYVLGSVPRCVFVMQAASDDTTDNRIVWTCCKNNDGELGARSAWERRNGLFAPVTDFDWDTFDSPHADDHVRITADDLAEIFENGAKQLRKAEAVKALQALTGVGRTACYDALKLNGRFAKQLRENDGLLTWEAYP